MKQPGTDSEFEAFRRDRNLRRRQRTGAFRPGGNTDIWQELEAQEAGELANQILNREVDDFFADATKLAANIVRKVAESREQEISDQLRREMEEFLCETIRRATNVVEHMSLADNGHKGEEIIEARIKNIDPSELDGFRAEGTARLDDKHFGQDPFATDLPEPGESAGAVVDEDADADEDTVVADCKIHLSEDALELDFGAEAESFEADEFGATNVAGSVVIDDTEPVAPEGEVPPAATAPADGEAEDASPAPTPRKKGKRKAKTAAPAPVATATPVPVDVAAVAQRQMIKDALTLLVQQGIMTKDQARAAYRNQVQSL